MVLTCFFSLVTVIWRISQSQVVYYTVLLSSPQFEFKIANINSVLYATFILKKVWLTEEHCWQYNVVFFLLSSINTSSQRRNDLCRCCELPPYKRELRYQASLFKYFSYFILNFYLISYERNVVSITGWPQYASRRIPGIRSWASIKHYSLNIYMNIWKVNKKMNKPRTFVSC